MRVQNGNAFQPVEVTLGRTSGDFVEVDNGLFEGDAIATQRATQLYAQSLRGGTKPSEPDKTVETSPSNGSSLPWWTMLIVGGISGGAIAATSFWLGRRSSTKMVIIREPSTVEHTDR